MRRIVPQLPLSVLILACSAALAAESGVHNRYKWYDANGSLHYSDALPAEAAKYGYEIVSPQGVVIKRVERARTTDELAAAKSAAAKDKAARDVVDQRTRADNQLLISYPTEADLQRAQKQQLEMMDQQVSAAQLSLRSQEQSLADLLARAAETERTGKTLPEPQANQLTAMRKQVDDQRIAVTRKQADRDQAVTRFESDTARYRDLQAKLSQRQP
jgi:hypothetical protein